MKFVYIMASGSEVYETESFVKYSAASNRLCLSSLRNKILQIIQGVPFIVSLSTEAMSLVNSLIAGTSRDKCHVKQHDHEQGHSVHRNAVRTSKETLYITVNKINQQKKFESKTLGKVQRLVTLTK
jgi:hypothetical protein